MCTKLTKYGLITIRDIDTIFDDRLTQEICALNVQLTIDKILMYGMIVNNADKFFCLEENHGIVISRDAHNLLSRFVDIESICEKYELRIRE